MAAEHKDCHERQGRRVRDRRRHEPGPRCIGVPGSLSPISTPERRSAVIEDEKGPFMVTEGAREPSADLSTVELIPARLWLALLALCRCPSGEAKTVQVAFLETLWRPQATGSWA
jgi:hypothetical protein